MIASFLLILSFYSVMFDNNDNSWYIVDDIYDFSILGVEQDSYQQIILYTVS